MRTSDTISEVAEALLLVQTEITNPTKDAKGQVRGNPNYAYASLPAILDEARPLLTKNGIALTQEEVTTDLGVGVLTRLLHRSGEWLEYGPLVLPRGGDAQATGSALTYARRYTLTAVLGIAADDEDDDGKRASGGTTAKANASRPRDAKSDQAAEQAVATPENPRASEAVEPLGEGLPASDARATDSQWERLLVVVGGVKNKALLKLNRANGTTYTWATAQDGATKDELERAITGEAGK